MKDFGYGSILLDIGMVYQFGANNAIFYQYIKEKISADQEYGKNYSGILDVYYIKNLLWPNRDRLLEAFQGLEQCGLVDFTDMGDKFHVTRLEM